MVNNVTILQLYFGLCVLYFSFFVYLASQFRNIAASQCQPTDARKIIPLFDEPELKANFTATITTQANYTSVLWNMPLRTNGNISTPNRPGFRTYSFTSKFISNDVMLQLYNKY